MNVPVSFRVSALFCVLFCPRMAKLQAVFSLRHMLVMSLALNVGLIMRMFPDSDETLANDAVEAGVNSKRETHVVQKSTTLSGVNSTSADRPGRRERVINLDHGDPTMYEGYWRQMGEKTTITIPGWQSLSYISDMTNVCWFLVPEFAEEVVRLHQVVGNAVTEDRHIVVGTGSSQLILAALYALSSPDAAEPISVVSAAPYYSSYPSMVDYQKSRLYKWAGDAESFNKDGPYIELVTSPNNPDGLLRRSVVNRSQGLLIHDLAYYWPQYTPITSPSDHDLSLFTVSKSTGHAGMRIGWALVKDRKVAEKMTRFIELNTIGVSKDSQLRAAKVLKAVSDGCQQGESSFFKHSYKLMAGRWKLLRATVEYGGLFSLPQFCPSFCTFFGQETEPQPAFLWLRCEGEIEDCEGFLRKHKIISRGGKHFGGSPKLTRISMLDTQETFLDFIERLSNIQQIK
ncbi:hypothetical protein RJT34_33276 [Clitoria ternatea]|uniref:Alliinase C-terminal domain-containing protein n=1 Tax=Clitoria ternatea TaxID=43366 RepID=A0AAN9F5K4_CLITE